MARQAVAPGRTAGTHHQPGRLQLQQDLNEKTQRDALGVGNGFDADRLGVIMIDGQFQHGNARIFSFRRDSHGFPGRSRIEHGLNATSSLMFEDVETALLFLAARPTAGPVIFAGAYRLGAWPASNARVSFVVERIIRHIMLEDEVPNVALGPRKQRIDLHQAEFGVPLYEIRGRTVSGLIAPNGADPSFVTSNSPP